MKVRENEPAVPTFDSRVAFDVTDIEEGRLVFRHEITEEQGAFYYARRAQPTVERLLGYLKQIQHARWAVGTSSGMAAVDLLLHSVIAAARIRKARPIVAFGDGIYYEVERLIRSRSELLGFDWARLCTTDADQLEQGLQALPEDRLALLWLETPANPLLGLSDIGVARALLSRRAPDALLAVDNSALPLFQRSLEDGADIEVLSLTKYVNGMGDAMGGCVLTDDASLAERLRGENDGAGAVLSAGTAHLIANNVTTLHLRMRQHCDNAAAVAMALCEHPAVSQVYYPLLPDSCPGYSPALIQRQMRGVGGGLVSLRLRGGFEAGERLMRAVLDAPGASAVRSSTLYIIPTFGMPSTNVEHYYSFIRHREGLARDATSEGQIGPGFCRIAVGLASATDIISDLTLALDRAH